MPESYTLLLGCFSLPRLPLNHHSMPVEGRRRGATVRSSEAPPGKAPWVFSLESYLNDLQGKRTFAVNGNAHHNFLDWQPNTSYFPIVTYFGHSKS
jgi:hypothetical protein